ncbi:hypothetical protein [Tabrizicola sp. YIM 78059]|uniref:hypothetical protein n=1 Tax=Tabrizicola sp. YIM 78059 TaxID=2529861 RepID=UPI0010AAFBF3|nr:hypothetical protein [Tabrizicola sp. YIM 78059]
MRDLVLLCGWQSGKDCLGAVGILGGAVPIGGLPQSDGLRKVEDHHDRKRVIGSKRMGMKPCRKVNRRHGAGHGRVFGMCRGRQHDRHGCRKCNGQLREIGHRNRLLGNDTDGMLPGSVCPG